MGGLTVAYNPKLGCLCFGYAFPPWDGKSYHLKDGKETLQLIYVLLTFEIMEISAT